MTNESGRTLFSLINTAISEPTLLNLSALYDFGVENDLQDQVDLFLKNTSFPFSPIHDMTRTGQAFRGWYFDDGRLVYEYKTTTPLIYSGDEYTVTCLLFCDFVTDEENEINERTICNSFDLDMFLVDSVSNAEVSSLFTDKLDVLTYVRMLSLSGPELEAFLVPYIDRLLKIPFCRGNRP